VRVSLGTVHKKPIIPHGDSCLVELGVL
jgi:hypothetical protein